MEATSIDVIDESRAILARHARTFSLASFFLSKSQKDDAAVVYAFCRTVDDLVDEAVDAETGRKDIEALAQMLRGERPPSALAAAFMEVAHRRRIPLQAAHDLMDGVVSDVGEVTVKTDAELIQYGYAVAGTVGLMMCGVIGVEDEWAQAHAIDLGIGMQITNICRDVMEDADRGRIYVPTQRLLAAGIHPEALRSGLVDPVQMAPVVEDLLALADSYYASGDQGMPAIPTRPRLAICAASRVYHAIGHELERQDHDVTRGRAVVPGWRKALCVVRAVFMAATCRWMPQQPHDTRLHLPLQGRPGVSDAEPLLRLVNSGNGR